MIINNPNCKHKKKIKGGEASIITSMVSTSGPKCVLWYTQRLSYHSYLKGGCKYTKQQKNRAMCSCGLTKDQHSTQISELSDNSQRHAKLKTTLDVFFFVFSFNCNCERFTAPHNLYVKKQVLKSNIKISWNVINPLALIHHFLNLSIK